MGGAFLSSCSKTVDVDPTHTVNGENFFTTVEDYDLALTGAYQRLKLNSLYGGVNGGSVFLCAVDKYHTKKKSCSSLGSYRI